MKTPELIAVIGDQNVAIQFLDNCMIRADMTKTGSKITFGTDVRLQIDKIEKSGMIVWMDREQLKAALAAPVVEKASAEVDHPDYHSNLRDRFMEACQQIGGPEADVEGKMREVRMDRRDGLLCIPYPILASIDQEQIPSIVSSYIDAFDEGRRVAIEEATDLRAELSRMRQVARDLQIELLRGDMDVAGVERSVDGILEIADKALAVTP